MSPLAVTEGLRDMLGVAEGEALRDCDRVCVEVRRADSVALALPVRVARGEKEGDGEGDRWGLGDSEVPGDSLALPLVLSLGEGVVEAVAVAREESVKGALPLRVPLPVRVMVAGEEAEGVMGGVREAQGRAVALALDWALRVKEGRAEAVLLRVATADMLDEPVAVESREKRAEALMEGQAVLERDPAGEPLGPREGLEVAVKLALTLPRSPCVAVGESSADALALASSVALPRAVLVSVALAEKEDWAVGAGVERVEPERVPLVLALEVGVERPGENVGETLWLPVSVVRAEGLRVARGEGEREGEGEVVKDTDGEVEPCGEGVVVGEMEALGAPVSVPLPLAV